MKKPSIKLLASLKDFLGEIAKWAVKQHPYNVPDNLEVILNKFSEMVSHEFVDEPFGFKEFEDFFAVKEFARKLFDIPEFLEWNLSKAEKDAGVKYDDPSRPSFLGCSRFNNIIPEHDFIDLDALILNVVAGILKLNNMENIKFNVNFTPDQPLDFISTSVNLEGSPMNDSSIDSD